MWYVSGYTTTKSPGFWITCSIKIGSDLYLLINFKRVSLFITYGGWLKPVCHYSNNTNMLLSNE